MNDKSARARVARVCVRERGGRERNDGDKFSTKDIIDMNLRDIYHIFHYIKCEEMQYTKVAQ